MCFQTKRERDRKSIPLSFIFECCISAAHRSLRYLRLAVLAFFAGFFTTVFLTLAFLVVGRTVFFATLPLLLALALYLRATCAAASRAIGTRNGEQDT